MALLPVGAIDNSYEREARRVNFFQTGQVPPLVGGGTVEGGVAAIDGEVKPAYLSKETSGSFYTTGRGHSNFGAFAPYLA